MFVLVSFYHHNRKLKKKKKIPGCTSQNDQKLMYISGENKPSPFLKHSLFCSGSEVSFLDSSKAFLEVHFNILFSVEAFLGEWNRDVHIHDKVLTWPPESLVHTSQT